jgi:hypothetical protein
VTRIYLIQVIAIILIAACIIRPSDGANRLSGSVSLGFDSFIEKYSIVEEDTVDSIVEFGTRMDLRYINGSPFKDFFLIEGLAFLGESSTESTGRLSLARSVGRNRFGLEADLTSKRFWDNSYAYPNDYIRHNGRLFFSRTLGTDNSIMLSENLENMDFDHRSEFDYDYMKNSVSLDLDLFRPLSTSIHTALTAIYKSVPDSTQISYKSYSLSSALRWHSGLHKGYYLYFAGERRTYAHRPTLSPYWALTVSLNAEPIVMGSYGIAFDNTIESYLYDTNSDIYFDYAENKSSALVMYHRSYFLDAGIGPAFAFLSSSASADDRYEEIGGKALFEFIHMGRVWLSATYEFGKRYYSYYEENPVDALFSDYFYNRFSIFANLNLWRNLGTNGFISHEPVNHKRAGDDTSTTLFSIDLSYDF